MATLTSTIKSAGGIYTSRSAWWAAKGGQDLVTLTNIEQAECYDFEDTTAFSMTTGTTNATNYYRIFTAAGNKHNGSFGTGARMVVSVSFGFAINAKVAYTKIEDQSIYNTNASNAGIIDFGGFDYIQLSGNILKAEGVSNRDGVQAEYITGFVCKDNLIISNTSVDTLALTASSGFVYNNTCINLGASTGNAFGLGNASLTLKNNIGQENGTGVAFHKTTYSGTASHNLSNDTSASNVGTNAVDSTTLTFDAGYNLVSADTAAHTAGLGTSSDAEVRSVDNIDVARPATTICSIGCREYVTAGGGFKPIWAYNASQTIGFM